MKTFAHHAERHPVLQELTPEDDEQYARSRSRSHSPERRRSRTPDAHNADASGRPSSPRELTRSRSRSWPARSDADGDRARASSRSARHRPASAGAGALPGSDAKARHSGRGGRYERAPQRDKPPAAAASPAEGGGGNAAARAHARSSPAAKPKGAAGTLDPAARAALRARDLRVIAQGYSEHLDQIWGPRHPPAFSQPAPALAPPVAAAPAALPKRQRGGRRLAMKRQRAAAAVGGGISASNSHLVEVLGKMSKQTVPLDPPPPPPPRSERDASGAADGAPRASFDEPSPSRRVRQREFSMSPLSDASPPPQRQALQSRGHSRDGALESRKAARRDEASPIPSLQARAGENHRVDRVAMAYAGSPERHASLQAGSPRGDRVRTGAPTQHPEKRYGARTRFDSPQEAPQRRSRGGGTHPEPSAAPLLPPPPSQAGRSSADADTQAYDAAPQEQPAARRSGGRRSRSGRGKRASQTLSLEEAAIQALQRCVAACLVSAGAALLRLCLVSAAA